MRHFSSEEMDTPEVKVILDNLTKCFVAKLKFHMKINFMVVLEIIMHLKTVSKILS